MTWQPPKGRTSKGWKMKSNLRKKNARGNTVSRSGFEAIFCYLFSIWIIYYTLFSGIRNLVLFKSFFYIRHKGFDIDSLVFFINLGYIRSGPGDLLGLSVLICLIISTFRTSRSNIYFVMIWLFNMGMHPSGSFVNTLDKYSAKIWAFL